jgi:hypothetical protein
MIPSRVWDPTVHQTYPKRFRESIKEIMLCSHAPAEQPLKVHVESNRINLASKLPIDVWMKILSYTHRSWFDQPYKINESFLRQQLRQEQQATQRAKDACAEAERRMRLAERERDGYKLLAMRWQLRLRSVLNGTSKSSASSHHSRSSGARREEDPLLMLDDLTDVVAASIIRGDNLFPRTSRRGRHQPIDADDNSDVDDDEGDNDDDNEDVLDTETMHMESEDEDDNTNHEMEDATSEEDNSENLSLAASPDTSDGSFFRQVSESLENQAFFT